jgi:hypothetical protein
MQKSVAAAAWSAFCNGGSLFLLVYYIPFWQQVIRNASAASSGISLLPFVLGVVVMANMVGFLVMKFGYCRSFRLESLWMEPSQLIAGKLRCPLHATLFHHYAHWRGPDENLVGKYRFLPVGRLPSVDRPGYGDGPATTPGCDTSYFASS